MSINRTHRQPKNQNSRHNLHFQMDLSPEPILYNYKSEYYMPWLYSYKRNSFGFRSIEFHKNTELVTLGCSHTYGAGMPEEYTWPSFVCDITGIKDYVNLGKPGSSIFFQVRLLANYINNYGPPKVVLANFPDLNRYETIDDNGNIKYGRTEDVSFQDFLKSSVYSEFQSLQALNFLEAMCKSGNIKLVWQFWSGFREKNSEDKLNGNLKNILGDAKEYFSYCSNLCDHDGWNISNNFFKFNKKKKQLTYLGEDLVISCCKNLYQESKDCFFFAYDRYRVSPEHERVYIEKQLLDDKLYLTTSDEPGMNAHLGSHSHWHWAKNLTENM